MKFNVAQNKSDRDIVEDLGEAPSGKRNARVPQSPMQLSHQKITPSVIARHALAGRRQPALRSRDAHSSPWMMSGALSAPTSVCLCWRGAS